MAAPLGFKTFVTGDVLTAADTNGYLMQGIWTFANATARDAAVTSPQEGNTCYLKDTDNLMIYSGSAWVTKSAGGAASYIGANVYNSVSQNITTNTDTVVTFDSERNDTNAFHSTSTNTGRITIPTGYGGKYQIRAQFKWNSGTLTNLFMGVRKNGTVILTQPAFSLQQSYIFQEDLVAGDYLDISVFQNSGGTLTINASGDAANQSRQEFSVIYLGA
jgi:hypothetical protein